MSARYRRLDQKGAGADVPAAAPTARCAGRVVGRELPSKCTTNPTPRFVPQLARSTVRKKAQRRPLSSPRPQDPRETSVNAIFDDMRLRSRGKEDIVHVDQHLHDEHMLHNATAECPPPRLLIAQDLRDEKTCQPQMHAVPSINANLRTLFREELSLSVSSLNDGVEENTNNTTDDFFLQPHRAQSAGAVFSDGPNNPTRYHCRYGDTCTEPPSRSTSLRRTSGPVVTEAWSRSVVRPEDEYLLYEHRRVPGNVRRDDRTRRNRFVELREWRRHVGESKSAVRKSSATAVPVLSIDETLSESQRRLRRHISTGTHEDTSLEEKETERDRTIRMNEQQMLARGTLLLFSRPRTRLFASGKSHIEGCLQKGGGDTLGNAATTVTACKYGADVSDTMPLKQDCDSSVTVSTPILQTSPNPQGHSSAVVENSNGLSSLISADSKEGAGGGKNGTTLTASPLSLFFATDTQDAAKLFENPLFVLYGDENCGRLLLAQEEHEAREVLLQQHNASLELGRSVLPTLCAGNGSQSQCKYEVFVGVMGPQRTKVQGTSAAMQTRKGDKHTQGNSDSRSRGSYSGVYRVVSSPVSEKGKQNNSLLHVNSGKSARYVVSSSMLSSGKTGQSTPRWSVVSEKCGTERPAVDGSAKSDGRQETKHMTVSVSSRSTQGKANDVANSKAAGSATPVEDPASLGDVNNHVKAALPSSHKRRERPANVCQGSNATLVSEGAVATLRSTTSSLKHMENGGGGDGLNDTVRSALEPISLSLPAQQIVPEESRPTDSSKAKPLNGSEVVHMNAACAAAAAADALEAPGAMQTCAGARDDHFTSTASTHSAASDVVFAYREDDPDAELYEYLRFARRLQRCAGSCGELNENIRHSPGVLWLEKRRQQQQQHPQRQKLGARAAEDLSAEGDSRIIEDADDEDVFCGESDDDLRLSEDGNHYAKNVNCVLRAFGEMWRTSFHNTTRPNTLPHSVQAQMLLFDDF